jgi:protease I
METSSKKILIIIARKDFRDEEYFIPKDVFYKYHIDTITASSKTGPVLGVLGGEAEATLNIKDAQAQDFDAVVFVGGNGAQEYFENAQAHRLAREFFEAEKIIGAICIAPVILAKAGILKGQTAVVWENALDKTGPRALTEAGCEVTQGAVQRSGNIITGSGREASQEFAKEIAKALEA